MLARVFIRAMIATDPINSFYIIFLAAANNGQLHRRNEMQISPYRNGPTLKFLDIQNIRLSFFFENHETDFPTKDSARVRFYVGILAVYNPN